MKSYYPEINCIFDDCEYYDKNMELNCSYSQDNSKCIKDVKEINLEIKYKQALQKIIEEYTGMEGFISRTAPEAYLQSVLKRIYDIAVEALESIDNE